MEEMEGLKICLNCLWFSPRIKKGEQIYLEICEKDMVPVGKLHSCKNFISKKGQGLLEKKEVVLFSKEYIPQFFNSF